MTTRSAIAVCLLLIVLPVSHAAAAEADQPESINIVDVTADGAAELLIPSHEQVAVAASSEADKPGLDVSIAVGPGGWPGVAVKPQDAEAWDFSQYGHISARLTNTCDKRIYITMRVDNPGDWRTKPWNTDAVILRPGQSGELKVIFGYQNGKPAFKLDPSQITKVLLFSGKVKEPIAFRLESLTVGGQPGEKPPVDPKSIRIKPVETFLLGGPVTLDAEKQLKADDGVKVSAEERTFTAAYPQSDSEQAVTFCPPAGRWNLSETTEVRVKLTNVGDASVTAGVQVASSGDDATSVIYSSKPIASGATQEIVVPFAAFPGAGQVLDLAQKDKAAKNTFESHKVYAIRILTKQGPASLKVDSVRATVTTADIPEWLGKRPPVEGDWTMTLNEEFAGNSIDMKTWRVTGPNWWGRKELTHWSKDNVIAADGVATMRLEKKTGWHNDDPESGHKSDYAGGFFDSYGKWVQRYGYFEARMKLPTTPGVWPAFWLMPDRGVDVGPQWKRQDTGNGGMEFDIMEHLTRWGPYRYTTAMHWDGYGKNHKANGAKVYVRPDKDGYITSGLLWLPGEAVFYANGTPVARWKDDRICSVESCIIFTMPIGGWDNDPLDDSKLPADFVIDYVRVWQRSDLASEVDGYSEVDSSK